MTLSRLLLFFGLLGSAVSALAQSATLLADSTRLHAEGGVVALTARAAYEGAPGAVGVALDLPRDWELVAVSGPDVPSVAPKAGTSGKLEFAYLQTPASRLEFTVQVRYPAGVTAALVSSHVVVRNDGQMATAKSEPVRLRATPQGEGRDAVN